MMTEEQLIDRICLTCVDVRHAATEESAQKFINDIRGLAEQLAALTQPASPALKLPDGWRLMPDEPTEEMMRAMYQAQDMWPSAHCDNMRETQMSFARPRYIAAMATAPKAPSVPHTAPIEPLCATGGAEWVKVSERMPDPLSKKRICVYTPSEHDDFRFRFVPASLFKSVCSAATHWYYMAAPEGE